MLRMMAGMVTGVVVSGAILGTLSVIDDLSERAARREAAPEAGGVRVPPGSGFDAEREDREAALPQADESPDPGRAPRMTAPAPDDAEAVQAADTAPSVSPGIGAQPGPGAPPAPEGDAGLAAPRGVDAPGAAGRPPPPAQPSIPTPDAPVR